MASAAIGMEGVHGHAVLRSVARNVDPLVPHGKGDLAQLWYSTLNETFFLVGAALFGLLGLAHAVLTLRDLQVARSFTPIDENLRRAMAEAPLRLAPQTTIWNAWLGFNLSHSLGLLIFGTFFGALALHDFGMVAEHLFVRFSAVVVGLMYLVLALRFWFWVPAVLSAMGTLCFVVSALS